MVGEIKYMRTTGRYGEYRVPEGAVYCGRGDANVKRSPLANPYKVVEGEPGKAVRQFKIWLWNEMQNPVSDAALMIEHLAELFVMGEEIVLSCHCADAEHCHTAVIRRAIEWKIAQMVEVNDGYD